jgi:hypothetical protein
MGPVPRPRKERRPGKPVLHASTWRCDERGLFVLTSNGPEEVRIEAPFTHEEVWFWYMGRRYKYTKIDIRARREYVYHVARVSKEVHTAFKILAASLMNARFAAFQPKWTREKFPPIFINGEKVFFLQVSTSSVVVKYQDERHAFAWTTVGEPRLIELPSNLDMAFEKIGLMLWSAMPARKPKMVKMKPETNQLSFDF